MCEHLTVAWWEITCSFAKKENIQDYSAFQFPGIKLPIMPYQVMAVAWMLRQVPLSLGGFVADEQGPGKTIKALVFEYMASFLALCHRKWLKTLPS